ncbi:hypothetical protein [Dysosmobacter sp.]|uniref:hypothetical protein n=1 Tax=Dysosmobacter sp. TaxID=2591382 RepID=UPI003AB75C10
MSVALNRAVRYGIRNYLRAAGILLLVMLLIPLALWVMLAMLGNNGSNFNGYSLSVGVFGFVLGMVGIRENLRMLNQNGISRRTAFLAEIVSQAVVAVLVALGTTAVLAGYRALPGFMVLVEMSDVYQLLYEGADMGPASYLRTAVFSAAMAFSLAGVGQFWSVLYWRLSKFWTVIVSIAIPLVLIFGPAAVLTAVGDTPAGEAIVRVLAALGRFFIGSVWNAALVFLAVAAVSFALSWLLVRRAVIRGAK